MNTQTLYSSNFNFFLENQAYIAKSENNFSLLSRLDGATLYEFDEEDESEQLETAKEVHKQLPKYKELVAGKTYWVLVQGSHYASNWEQMKFQYFEKGHAFFKSWQGLVPLEESMIEWSVRELEEIAEYKPNGHPRKIAFINENQFEKGFSGYSFNKDTEKEELKKSILEELKELYTFENVIWLNEPIHKKHLFSIDMQKYEFYQTQKNICIYIKP